MKTFHSVWGAATVVESWVQKDECDKPPESLQHGMTGNNFLCQYKKKNALSHIVARTHTLN